MGVSLSHSLETFAPVIASGMCDLSTLIKKKKKEAIFTGIITGIYGPSKAQELWTHHVINPTQWGKRPPTPENLRSSFHFLNI